MDFGNFKPFVKLDIVNLSFNNIILKNNLKCCHLNLTTVVLVNNNMDQLDSSAFSLIPNLQKLHLGGNKIRNFTGSFNITVLHLDHNSLYNIPYTFFENVTKLEILGLQCNHIKNIDPRLFKNILNLKSLNLSYNNLVTLHYETFYFSKFLLSLDLSHNNLQFIHNLTFHYLPKLKHLYLNNNKLKFVNIDNLLSHSHDLKTVSLQGNLWICTKLLTMVQEFRVKDVFLMSENHYDTNNVLGIACKNFENEYALTSHIVKDSTTNQIHFIEEEMKKLTNIVIACFVMFLLLTSVYIGSKLYSIFFFSKTRKSVTRLELLKM